MFGPRKRCLNTRPVKKELDYDIKAGTNVKDYSELKRSARTGTTGGTWHICVLDKKKAP